MSANMPNFSGRNPHQVLDAVYDENKQILKTGSAGILSHGGSKTVDFAGTPERLSSTSVPCKSVIICMKSGNTGNVYIAVDSNVSSTDIPWPAGAIVEIPCNDARDVWLDVDNDGEGVNWQPLV